jgi:hypothetical protein
MGQIGHHMLSTESTTSETATRETRLEQRAKDNVEWAKMNLKNDWRRLTHRRGRSTQEMSTCACSLQSPPAIILTLVISISIFLSCA